MEQIASVYKRLRLPALYICLCNTQDVCFFQQIYKLLYVLGDVIDVNLPPLMNLAVAGVAVESKPEPVPVPVLVPVPVPVPAVVVTVNVDARG